LGAFSKEEAQAMEEVIRRAAGAVETWALSGLEACMNAFNPKPDPVKGEEQGG
jgi:peptidyl-tRNA hydrolase